MNKSYRIHSLIDFFLVLSLSCATLCSASYQRFQYPIAAHQVAGASFSVAHRQEETALNKASPVLPPNPCYVCNAEQGFEWDCRTDVENEKTFDCNKQDNALGCGVLIRKDTSKLTRACGGYAYNYCGWIDDKLSQYYCTCGAGNKCNDFSFDYMTKLMNAETSTLPFTWDRPPPHGQQLDFSTWRQSQRGGHYVVHVGYPGGSATSGGGDFATMAHDWNSNEPIHLHFNTAPNGSLVLSNGNIGPNHTHNDTNDFALKIKLRLVFHMPPPRELTYINGTPYDLPWPPAGTGTGGSTGGNGTGVIVASTPVSIGGGGVAGGNGTGTGGSSVDPNDGKPVVLDLYPPCGDNQASIAVCLNTKRFGYALTDMDGCAPSWCCCMSYCKGLVPTPHQCPIKQYFNPNPDIYTCQPRQMINSCRRIDGLQPLNLSPGQWTTGLGNGTATSGITSTGSSVTGGGTGSTGKGTGITTAGTDTGGASSGGTGTGGNAVSVYNPDPAVISSVAIKGQTWATSRCYDRCDTTYCKNKLDGYYENSVCSRNWCSCKGQLPQNYGCADGTFFDGSTGRCKAGNSTWCPPQPSTALTKLSALPSSQKDRCTVTNCLLRNGQFPYYALDCCSRYWCYCKGTGSSMYAEVQTCEADKYFDHRSEWVQCRDTSNFGFCPVSV